MPVSSGVSDKKMNGIDINFLSFLFTFFVPAVLVCILIGFFIYTGIHLGLRIFSPNYISDGEFRYYIIHRLDKIERKIINKEVANEQLNLLDTKKDNDVYR